MDNIDSSNNTTRNRAIDIAKGISMICIVLGHLGIANINRIVFTFHLPIFFIITGYFISTKRSKANFVKNRFRHLIVPYFITCVFITCLEVLKATAAGDDVVTTALQWIAASLYGAGDNYSEPYTIYSIGAIWFLWSSFWGAIILRYLSECKHVVRICSVFGILVLCLWSRTLPGFAPLSIQTTGISLLYMYFGYLLHKSDEYLKKADVETKAVVIIISFCMWIEFIIDFKSFWLVHSDIGRGMVDIVGSLCACLIIMLISQFIDKHFEKAVLAWAGKYSLLFLCGHIIELNTFPWHIFNSLLGDSLGLVVAIIGKFIWIYLFMIIVLKVKPLRKAYGF